MAISKGRNRASDFDDLADSAPADFDPEAENLPNDSESDDDADDTPPDDKREHYVDVGKSKLRKPKEVPLGPQYRGSKVRREEIDNEDEDDPFGRGFDEDESDEDDGLDELVDGSEDEDEDDVGFDDDTPATDVSGEDEDDIPASRPASMVNDEARAELRKAVNAASEQRHVTSSLLQGNRQEAEKGRAMKKQRTAFDSLLNTRIKLQKALVGVNNISGLPQSDLSEQRHDAQQAIEAAETAAFTLWSSLTTFRDDILVVKTGEKRKANRLSTATPTEDLWAHMQKQEKSSLEFRNASLQRWSEKTRVETLRSNINTRKDTAPTTIIDNIREHLANTDHLLRRAHTPRSCAPLQLAAKIPSDERIYDDADFYGLMLKELLESKAQDSMMTSTISNIDLSFQLRREAKTKKHVDVKASKGRKLKYTVHEKLQNYMAPENRCAWGERQADELFGSLFGQRMELGEGMEEEKEDTVMADGGEIDEEAAGLMMFRS